MKREGSRGSVASAAIDPVLLEDAARRAADYLTRAANRRVTPAESDVEALQRLHESTLTGDTTPNDRTSGLTDPGPPEKLFRPQRDHRIDP